MRLACGTLPPPSLLPPIHPQEPNKGLFSAWTFNTSPGELRCDWTSAGRKKHLLRGDQPTDAASTTTSGHSSVAGAEIMLR